MWLMDAARYSLRVVDHSVVTTNLNVRVRREMPGKQFVMQLRETN